MSTLLVLLIIDVVIGLVIAKAMLWYSISQDNTLSRGHFLVYWVGFLIIGQLWLPILSIVLYHSRKKTL